MINWLVDKMIEGQKDPLGRKITYEFCVRFINNHFDDEKEREKRLKQLNMLLIDKGREDLIKK